MISALAHARTTVSHAVFDGRIMVPLLCTVMASCGDASPELTEQQLSRVTSIGENAAGALMRGLGMRLAQAIETGGPAHAVAFCSGEALGLTDSIAHSLGADLKLKRTSLRFRNPDNAPDELEVEVLRHFEDRMPDSPSSYVQRVSEREIRYYQPLFVADLCLQCHGESDQIAPEVAALLAEKYPADAAIGYSTGDFRGLIRVSLPIEAATERSNQR